jgi:hypothetical protein
MHKIAEHIHNHIIDPKGGHLNKAAKEINSWKPKRNVDDYPRGIANKHMISAEDIAYGMKDKKKKDLSTIYKDYKKSAHHLTVANLWKTNPEAAQNYVKMHKLKISSRLT